MLNCKNPQKFLEVYEQAIEKHFKKQMQEQGVNNQQQNQQIGRAAGQVNVQDKIIEDNGESQESEEEEVKEEEKKSDEQEEIDLDQSEANGIQQNLGFNVNNQPLSSLDLDIISKKMMEL